MVSRIAALSGPVPHVRRGRQGRRVTAMQRGVLVLQVKRVGASGRTFTGVASTGQVDRVGDILEPRGAFIELPVPLLWAHQHGTPVGTVVRATVTDSGIEITGAIAELEGSGPLAMAANEAWQAVKSGLVTGLSVGFLPRASQPIKGGGRRFTSWDLLEVSIVTVPANAGARITPAAPTCKHSAAHIERLVRLERLKRRPGGRGTGHSAAHVWRMVVLERLRRPRA